MSMFSGRIALEVLAATLVFTSHASATEARYECSGGSRLTAQFSPPEAATGRVTLTFDNGPEIVLRQVMSADGGRYVGDGIEFWIKGRNASLIRAGNSETCAAR